MLLWKAISAENMFAIDTGEGPAAGAAGDGLFRGPEGIETNIAEVGRRLIELKPGLNGPTISQHTQELLNLAGGVQGIVGAQNSSRDQRRRFAPSLAWYSRRCLCFQYSSASPCPARMHLCGKRRRWTLGSPSKQPPASRHIQR